MAELRAKTTSSKVFIFSGLTDSLRKELAKKVVQLGAKSLDLKDFKTYCTHIITHKLTKSEKVLGGLSTGKWILHPDYIHHSLLAGSWLDEEQYEFCDDKIMQQFPGADPELFYASRRWRFLLGDNSYAFSGWKVAVVAGAKKAQVIKRLLISGGATVYNVKFPIERPDKVANTIAYVFVSEQSAGYVTSLLDYGVLCLKPEYIGDYLIKDPQPDVMNYLVQINETTQPEVNSTGPSSSQELSNDNSFLALSQTSFLSQTSSPARHQDHSLNSSTPISPLVPPDTVTVHGTSKTAQITKPSTPTNGNMEKSTPGNILKTAASSNLIDHSYTGSPEKSPGESLYFKWRNRKSQRLHLLIGKGSPVWKSLIPRSKTPVTCTTAEVNEKQSDPCRETMNQSHGSISTALDDLTTPSEASSTQGNQSLLNYQSTTSSSQIIKQGDSIIVKAEKLTPVELNKANATSADIVIDLTSDIDSEDEHSVQSQASSLKSRHIQSLNGKNLPVCKKEAQGSKMLGAENHDGDVELQSDMRNIMRKPLNTNVTTPKIDRGAIKSLPQMSSPITNFFKPLLIPKMEMEVNLSEEVEKALATSTPVVKDKTCNNHLLLKDDGKENGDFVAIPVERRKLRARKRHSTHGQETKTKSINEPANLNRSALPRIECSGDDLDLRTFGSIQGPTELLPNGDGQATPDMDQEALWLNGQRSTMKTKDSLLAEVLLDMKRQKVTTCEWRPLTYAYNQRGRETGDDSVFLPVTVSEIIHLLIDEDYKILALRKLYQRLSFRGVPQAKLLKIILFDILQNATSEMEANLAHRVLMKVLLLHPPITNDLQKLYLEVLSQNSTSIGAEWESILELLYSIMHEPDVQKRTNLQLMLDIITSMLQQNVQEFLLHRGHSHYRLGRNPMFLKIMWSPSYYVVFNSRCRQLLDSMTDAITLYRTETDSQRKSSLYHLLKDIIWMVAMVTETCRVLECGVRSGLQCGGEERMSIFVHELSKRLIDADITDPSLLDGILSMLQLPWLSVSVCQQILNTFDDYLLTDEQSLDIKLVNLTHIVKRYIFLLPRFHQELGAETPIVNSHRQNEKQPLQNRSQNKKGNHIEHSVLLNKAKKKNPKGETALHVACIKNDVAAVKQLLKIPGIDVNVKDNADWTPLHEACNHGNIECVQELLKFVPSKTVDLYFSDGTKHNKRADLLAAANGKGITPLHDAVLNNRLEVCRMLLQHGGARLLSAKTCLGYTALDFAETDEMFQVLSAFLPTHPRRNDSLDMSLVDSQGSSASIDEPPSDLLYDEVLNSAGKRRYTYTNSLQQYLHLILIMLTNYLLATNLLSISEKLTAKRAEALNTQASVGNECDQSVIVKEEDMLKTREGSLHIQEMKRDLRILKRLPFHLDLFKSHLLKLCRPEDCDLIQTEFLPLQALAETCS